MRRPLCFLTPVVILIMLFVFSIGGAEAKNYELPAIDPADFASGSGIIIIDNPYMPLVPGTTFIYSPVNEGNVVNTMEVTNETKVILGVTCIVVHDYETVDGVKDEDTYDWYALDKYGNVWYFGEATTKTLPDGTTSTEGSWEAGVDGAEPGIVMLASPMPGMSYRQEYYEGVAEDMGKVLRINAKVSVAYGNFGNCLMTKEWSPLDPGVVEQKYYAKGIGLVLIEELKGKTVRVELINKINP